jgi:hypothetical protein
VVYYVVLGVELLVQVFVKVLVVYVIKLNGVVLGWGFGSDRLKQLWAISAADSAILADLSACAV